jgi:hypothetical protein
MFNWNNKRFIHFVSNHLRNYNDKLYFTKMLSFFAVYNHKLITIADQ